MSASTSDRALRRLVADLAKSRPIDIESVLGDLDPGQRAVVEHLLTQYLHPDGHGGEIAASPPRAIQASGLSTFMDDKINAARRAANGHDDGLALIGGRSSRPAMTAVARAALLAAHADLPAPLPPPLPRAAKAPPSSFLQWLLGSDLALKVGG